MQTNNEELRGGMQIDVVSGEAEACRVVDALRMRDSSSRDGSLVAAVRDILLDVQRGGDDALVRLVRRFDVRPDIEPSERAGWDNPTDTTITADRLVLDVDPSLANTLDPADREAILQAKANIEAFHRPQAQAITVTTMKGVTCRRVFRPLQRVGLYIPSGTAPLISTMMMLLVPARLAGVKELVVCSPLYGHAAHRRVLLATAALLGVERIWSLGGAHAIAAMAFGTERVPKVEKICGPGNAYVTEAKRQVAEQGVAIDMLAGPSEVMVVAEDEANPTWVALDLLAQAEHDESAKVVLVTYRRDMALRIHAEVLRQLTDLPRAAIARVAMMRSATFVVDRPSSAIAAINAYAPEHLILHADVARCESVYLPQVRCAGSVFVGHLTAEALGDYASGTNHVLPTDRRALTMGGIGVETFGRMMTVQHVDQDGLLNLAPVVDRLAHVEGLEGHRRSVMLRAHSLSSHPTRRT